MFLAQLVESENVRGNYLELHRMINNLFQD